MRVTDTKNNRWFANKDFNMRNLKVPKGELLPQGWQVPSSIKYLKSQYGDDCVIWTKNIDGNGKDEDASELEILKAEMQKMQATIDELKTKLEDKVEVEKPIKNKETKPKREKSKRKVSLK
jgi:hypothetical protein